MEIIKLSFDEIAFVEICALLVSHFRFLFFTWEQQKTSVEMTWNREINKKIIREKSSGLRVHWAEYSFRGMIIKNQTNNNNAQNHPGNELKTVHQM